MNRSWITGLALAGVAGSAGAAFAGASAGDVNPVTAPDALLAPAAAIDTTPHDRTVSYQVGAAGTVSVTVTAGTLSVSATTAGEGWTVAPATGSPAHVQVDFTDAVQVVTFSADLVNDEIVVSLTNLPAPAPAPAPIAITVIPAAPAPVQHVAAPVAATPPAPRIAEPAEHVTTEPAPATTSAPSGEGEDHEDDNGDHNEQESEDD